MSGRPGGSDGVLRRIVRAPLLHFVLLGSALFALKGWLEPPAPRSTIRIDESELAALEAEWVQRTGRPPDDATLAALVDRRIDDELLLQEAYALGWHYSDAIVVRRLLMNQRFLDPDHEATDAELLARAFEQGMERSDIVVRRRLLERMRLLVGSRARTPPPSDTELAAWLAAHPKDFERPPRVQLSHVFLSRDRRGDALLRDARSMTARLRDADEPAERAAELGDPFLLPSHLPLWSEAQLASQLGAEFAAAAMQAPLGRWSDPIESSYGAHVVFVHRREPREDPPLEEVRSRVEAALLREREQAAVRDHVSRLREQTRIEIASRPR
jgi:hypothetical protein